MLACWSNFRAASPDVGQRQSDATSGLCHVLTRGIGKNPDTTLLKNGDLDGALADYTEAIRLKPDHASTHYKGLAKKSPTWTGRWPTSRSISTSVGVFATAIRRG